jgi:hypothetical protein
VHLQKGPQAGALDAVGFTQHALFPPCSFVPALYSPSNLNKSSRPATPANPHATPRGPASPSLLWRQQAAAQAQLGGDYQSYAFGTQHAPGYMLDGVAVGWQQRQHEPGFIQQLRTDSKPCCPQDFCLSQTEALQCCPRALQPMCLVQRMATRRSTRALAARMWWQQHWQAATVRAAMARTCPQYGQATEQLLPRLISCKGAALKSRSQQLDGVTPHQSLLLAHSTNKEAAVRIPQNTQCVVS